MRRQGARPRPYLVATHSFSARFHNNSVSFLAIQRLIISYQQRVITRQLTGQEDDYEVLVYAGRLGPKAERREDMRTMYCTYFEAIVPVTGHSPDSSSPTSIYTYRHICSMSPQFIFFSFLSFLSFAF